jgi:acetyl-CoA acyltransferase
MITIIPFRPNKRPVETCQPSVCLLPFGFAPVAAANEALRRAGITWEDVSAVELNEAFAVQSLACVDTWKIDPEIVNTKGGALALGASGGRILGTLAKRLVESGDRYGIASICTGVGQALAVVLENGARS